MKLLTYLALISLIVGVAHAQTDPVLPQFLDAHCISCHNKETTKGKVDLSAVLADPANADAGLMDRIHEVIVFEEMPPEDEPQPKPEEREILVAALETWLAQAGQEIAEKEALPGHGNYVDHRQLFTEPEVRKAATPARLWRLSPHIFMHRANSLAREPLLRPKANQGGDGLHPSFAYLTPPHTFRDHSKVHGFEEATTELLFDISWQIAGIQVSSKKGPSFIEELLENPKPTARDWRPIIGYQFLASMRREPTEDEYESLIGLAEETRADVGTERALQTVLAAVLMKPEAVFRYELGQGEPDQYGRVHLAPYEMSLALAYALTDLLPDQNLKEAAEAGQLNNRKQVRQQVKRLLADEDASRPRVLRFFQEYFEYPRATEVFKDGRQANAIFANERVADADEFVNWILDEDRDVLKRLLTEDRFFVFHKGIPNREGPEKRARRDVLPDYGFPGKWEWEKNQPVKPLVGKRSGMLTHPAWLLAFSDNEKNQAIQRGRWIQMKLLGGTVPDTPIGVDAKLPDDPHLTLREKMQEVTTAEYCWRCHQKMDPLGLPLEQFDDFGRYRETELDRPVNTQGNIAVGVEEVDGEVADPFEMLLRLAEAERVEQVFIRHAFRYFLGRNETLDDAPTLIDAHQAYRESGGSMNALITSLLTSDSFIYRSLPAETLASATTTSTPSQP